MVEIRAVRSNELVELKSLVEQAFAGSDLGHHGEAELVEVLSQTSGCLSLVAVEGSELVGQVCLSPVVIEYTDDSQIVGMGLGPMCVATSRQQKGIGTQLINEGFVRLRELKCPTIVVLGDPAYYRRFGFGPAIDSDLTHGFDGIPQHFFLANILDKDSLQSSSEGRVSYRPEFGPQWT